MGQLVGQAKSKPTSLVFVHTSVNTDFLQVTCDEGNRLKTIFQAVLGHNVDTKAKIDDFLDRHRNLCLRIEFCAALMGEFNDPLVAEKWRSNSHRHPNSLAITGNA
jgi:hypothetical protein